MESGTEIWSSMLKSASTANATPHGAVFVLGTNPEIQNAVIERLHKGSRLEALYGLGFTNVEFSDANAEILSTLDIYTIDNRDEVAAKMLQVPLEQNENALMIIALDWQYIELWAEELSRWIEFIKMTRNDKWKNREAQLEQRFKTYTAPSEEAREFGDVELPLEEGQFDAQIGIDICIALVGSDWISEQSTVDEGIALDDDIVDTATQYIRTIALKHGASVISFAIPMDFDAPGVLDIVSERLKLQVRAKDGTIAYQQSVPNVIDYNQYIIPAGWDTKGKILAVKDGFAFDQVRSSWDQDDIDQRSKAYMNLLGGVEPTHQVARPAVEEIPNIDYQEFLAKQYEVLEAKLSDEPVRPQIGTGGVDFNVGGIQVESVDEVLRRIKAREAASAQSNAPMTPDRRSSSNMQTPTTPSPAAQQNDMLQTFFQNLLDRRRNSPGNTPSKSSS